MNSTHDLIRDLARCGGAAPAKVTELRVSHPRPETQVPMGSSASPLLGEGASGR